MSGSLEGEKPVKDITVKFDNKSNPSDRLQLNKSKKPDGDSALQAEGHGASLEYETPFYWDDDEQQPDEKRSVLLC